MELLQVVSWTVVLCFVVLHGVDAHNPRLRMTHTIQCQQCNDSSVCRRKDCRVPVGQEVNVTCTLHDLPDDDNCNPNTHPLSIHRWDVEGHREIHQGGSPDEIREYVLPGFQSLDTLDANCGIRLRFSATADIDNAVFQCALYVPNLRLLSTPLIVGIREPADTAPDVSSMTTTLTPTPTPSSTPTPSLSHSANPSVSHSAQIPSESVSAEPLTVTVTQSCGTEVSPTSIPLPNSGAQRLTHTLSTLLVVTLTLLFLYL